MSLIRNATQADIPFIMETEQRMPGFEWVAGRWDEASHRREMGRAATSYVVGERDSVPVGFAILQDLDDPFGNVLLKRIAIREPGRGPRTRSSPRGPGGGLSNVRSPSASG